MGSEKRSREGKRARRSPSVPQEEESTRSKRRKSTEPSDDKSKKRSSKLSSSHSKEKKSEEKHKIKHHKRDRNLANAGDNPCLAFPKHEFKELSKDDYFSKSNEFATWLKEEKDVFFSDLSSDSARELFSQFVKAWNKQKLEPRYYEGIASGPRSSHKWKIKQ
ncbi:hypothetical protein RJ641_000653 [Dillenia turbinata]|uniref:Style cell-cycle inhibitor 1-A n=1 Tax=Dillenia turbinata TaxID=194707 RepID=A0AAN8W728_9MAGN